jgi:peptidoglycan/LPS O-acetylase OafA/YrhL
MPRTPRQVDEPSGVNIGELFNRAASQGKRWVADEFSLARAELADLRRRCITAAVFAVAAMATLLCALIVLAQAGVAAAVPYLGSETAAGVAIGAVLLMVAVGCGLVTGRMFDWRPQSPLLRWMRK